MTTETPETKQEIMARLNSETSKMAWSEMQTFFASGNVVFVDASLDLIDIASEFSLDNKPAFEVWIKESKVGAVTDEQAKEWLENDVTVWAVVVAPWVLVQPVKSDG